MAFIPFPDPILKATFQRRYKRFLADMTFPDGSTVTAHCANTGSMKSCLVPDAPVLLWDSQNPKRKLRHSWKAIRIGRTWVGIDTGLPNALAEASVLAGEISIFGNIQTVRREVPMGAHSRVDLLVEADTGTWWVEVKNVTLVENGVARFPDAVTTRGLKHLNELMERVREGNRAAMLFVVQRNDGKCVEPADDLDPAYGHGLREAKAKGVELLALGARVSPKGVETTGLLPVILPDLDS